ncbi:MAG: PAS domain-containing protein [Planctomycetota bacterium]
MRVSKPADATCEIATQGRIDESPRDAERDCRALIENLQSGVALYEAVDGGADFRLLAFNTAAERIDDVSRETVIGRLVTEVFPGVAEFGLLDVLRRVFETGRSEHYPARSYQDHRIAGWRENYVYRLPSGAVAAVYEDVTAKKQAERTLETERSQFLSMFDSMDEVVYVADPNTHEILYANGATNRCYGESQGRKCHELFQGRDAPCPYCTNDLIFGDKIGRTHTWEQQSERSLRWYRRIDRAIYWPDGRAVRFEVAIDITDQKTAEEELKRQLVTTSESKRMLELLLSNSGEREHRMILLKEEVNELLVSSGRPPKYDAPGKVRESNLEGALRRPGRVKD